MKKILIVGAGGQIGSELVPYLRSIYGSSNVVATDVRECKSLSDDGPFEGTRRAERHQHGVGRRTSSNRHDFQSGSVAVGGRRAQSADGVGREHGRVDELARSGAPAPLRGIHAEFDRRIRSHVAEGRHAAGHDNAADDDIRHLQGYGRDARQLLRPQIRARHAFSTLPWHHLQQDAAGRRNDRLCRRNLLRSDSPRRIHLRRTARRIYGHDVHGPMRCVR